MKIWFQKNYKLVITLAFLVPIITVAIVSISHVTRWYGITNPLSWAIYLSVGIEIAALSSLAAISVDMGKKVYFPFGVATLIQFIGNVFFAYSFIDTGSDMFKSWVELSSPLISLFGVDSMDIIANKRFLAFFAGGMLPVISLSFLHMLIRFTEEESKKKLNEVIIRPTEDGIKIADEILKDVPPLVMEKIMSDLSKEPVIKHDIPSPIPITEEDIKRGFVDLGDNRYMNIPLDGKVYIVPPKDLFNENKVLPNITEDEIKKLENVLSTKYDDSIEDDMDVDYPDDLEDLENEFEGNRDIDESELDEEIERLIPEEVPTNETPVEESLWKKLMKKHQERIDNGEIFDDEPTALANSGRTQMLDDSGFPILVDNEYIGDGTYGTDPDPEPILEDYVLSDDSSKSVDIEVLPEGDDSKKKILDPSNEEEINTLPINEDQSLPKSDKPASIIDHKLY